MKQINPDHKFTINFRESDRPFIKGLLLSKKTELIDDIDLAKCDDDEEKVYQLENNLWAVDNLLDQIDLQVQEAEMEEGE